jgi:hypothetical protein
MNLELNDKQTTALIALLKRTIADDPYPLSPRVQTSQAILAKLQPEPVRAPLPPRNVYAPPTHGRYRRRG